jgi:sugar phosphate isomerase/epimerase
MNASRRTFLRTATYAASAAVFGRTASAAPQQDPALARELGITTGSFMAHLRKDPQLHQTLILDLPQRMRDELGMRVIDLMHQTLPSLEPAYLDRLRDRAEKYGCILTNLKMNQDDVNMASLDADERRRSLDVYKKTIDAAARLGCRWVRPAPRGNHPDLDLLAASYRELIDYAGPQGVSLLVENNGWMKDDPQAIPAVVRRVGDGIAAGPDTGNWTDQARAEGLAQAFPLAVTCDFKAMQFGPNGEHPQYDLERCFRIGWDAGFRGPWCFEHFNVTLDGLWKGFARLRDLLRGWMTT